MTKARVALLFLMGFLVALTAGCRGTAPIVALAKDVPATGWRMYPAPTTGNGVGTIFGINKKAVQFQAKDLSHKIPTTRSSAVVFDVTKGNASNISIGAAVSVVNNGVPADFKGDLRLQKQVGAKIVLRDVEHVQTLDVVDAQKAIADSLEELKKPGAIVKPGTGIYLVLETYRAKGIDITFENAGANQADLTAVFSKLVTINPSVGWSSGSSAVLKRDFSEPYNVLFLAERVATTGGLTGASAVQLLKLGNDEIIELRPKK